MLSSQRSVSSLRASEKKNIRGERGRAGEKEKGPSSWFGFSHRREIARMTPEVAGLMYADVEFFTCIAAPLAAALSAVHPLFLAVPFVPMLRQRAPTYKDASNILLYNLSHFSS